MKPKQGLLPLLLALAGLLATQGALAKPAQDSSKPTTPAPVAKVKKKAAENSAAAAQSMMPKPAIEMMKLSKEMIGNWKTVETFEKSTMMPNGGKGSGFETCKAGPGGLSVIQEYKSHDPMGHFSGHGVLSWDPNEKAYHAFWIDSMNPKGMVSVGKDDGGNIVLEADSEDNGQKMKIRQTVSNITPNSYVFTMESSMDGGSTYMKMMTIDYTRVQPDGTPVKSDKPEGK